MTSLNFRPTLITDSLVDDLKKLTFEGKKSIVIMVLASDLLTFNVITFKKSHENYDLTDHAKVFIDFDEFYTGTEVIDK